MLLTALVSPPVSENWCRLGATVMIPDGREGPVTQLEGKYCGVLVYGTSRVSLWAYYLIEPVDEPAVVPRRFGH